MKRACLSILVGLSATTAWASPPDCGRLPRGQNPSVQELDEAIARASAEHHVPTEVIKAVAWQESSCQQWRPDGTFVYNTSDCGLGLMQLTGATAEQFDIDQLKDDWRYNLDAGVRVLVQKWERAQRRNLVPADPEARRVLENWYHPIAFYWGRTTEEYLRLIYGHMATRPGALQRLLRHPVEVSIASEVIPGFEFGDAFTAYPDHRFVDAEGNEHRAHTHVGTIGDPETMAALEALLERAERAVERGRTSRAVEYLVRIVEVGFDTEHTARARELLDQLLAQARAQIDEARRLHDEGDDRAARRILRDVKRDFEDTELGQEADELYDAYR